MDENQNNEDLNNEEYEDLNDEENETVIISYEDGGEVEYEIVGVFEVEEEDSDLGEYVALAEIDTGGLAFFSYSEEGEEVIMDYIEDDDEYNLVSNTFFELVKDDEDFQIELDDEE